MFGKSGYRVFCLNLLMVAYDKATGDELASVDLPSETRKRRGRIST